MKQAVQKVSGPYVLLQRDDIDTDALFPAEYLTVTTKTGMRQYLFADWLRNGNPEAAFVAQSQPADVLIAPRNFGCGSSREHAVWALADYGVKAIIALSFGDIFRNNCVKNKVVAAQVSPATHAALTDALQALGAHTQLTLDVASQRIELGNGQHFDFELAAGHAEQLMSAEDDIDRTLRHENALRAHESRLALTAPWLVPAA